MEVESKYHVTEEELGLEQKEIDAAKKDPKKFAVIYDRYYEQIFRFIYLRVDDKDVAFDITQQTFIKAIEKLKDYEFRGVPFASWLYRVALNEINQLFRHNEKYRTVSIESENVYGIIDELKEEPLEKYYDAMVNSISQLPEDELQIVEMRFFEKRSFKEIGQIYNITENNAKVRLYRILEKLKRVIVNKQQSHE